MTSTTFPEIKEGNWTFAGEGGRADAVDPALSYNGIEFRAGQFLGSAELRQAALDLMKLAGKVAAAGF